MIDGVTISSLIAKRDVLRLKISVIRDFLDNAGINIRRMGGSEIKILPTVKVSAKQKELDELSRQLRELDTKLQGANWTIDLL